MIPLDDAPAAGGRRAAVREREDAVVASLRSLGTALDGEPDPAFRTATRSRLVAMAAVRTPEPAPAPRSLLTRVLAVRPEPVRSPLRRRLTAGLAGAALAVTALATLVAVAAGSAPGDPLYGLKRGTEQSQLALSGSDRGLTLLGFAHTRLTELAALTGAGDTDLAVSTLRSMDEQTTAGAAALTAQAVADRDPAAGRRLTAWEAGQSAGLAALRPQLPAGARPAVDQSEALLTRVGDRGTALATALQCTAGPAVGGSDPLGPVPVPCATATSSAPAQGTGGAAGSVPGTTGSTVPAPGTGGSTTGTGGASTGSGSAGTGGSGTGGTVPGGTVPGGTVPGGTGSGGVRTGGALPSTPSLPTTGLPGAGTSGGLLPPVGTGTLPSSKPGVPSIGVTVPPVLPGAGTSGGTSGSTTGGTSGSTTGGTSGGTSGGTTGGTSGSTSGGTGSLPGVPSVSVCAGPVTVGNC